MGQGNGHRQFGLDGRVAFVTGSSAGLGKAIALSLGEAGARVALNYQNNRERAESTYEAFRGCGYEGVLLRGNVIDEADVNRMVGEIEAQLGGVDIVVANATPDQPQKPIELYDWEFYQEMIDFFIKSPFLLARATVPQMKKRRRGRIPTSPRTSASCPRPSSRRTPLFPFPSRTNAGSDATSRRALRR